ncbi:WAMTP1-MAML2 fusion protein, putative (macronuclear) [Tetrahymena thermophila SB210]|uniref:WAMTP1-MAML2 fusion protein, putative n=1 Tax=Tetrahymena thermophila (strain SB210) TaxID=312017 RepID=Q22S55_TETTS|nr:WAMTP1-MAML2 fusion protein, putative [Tetrahymena thermophila SB210]EAR87917.2 WAMTP1-MAML2 fusion protein, putative [Tetrahymena thermophila SB210]|eukprot:XP_001008162.2 WAMTP1-MAML2 fusion protein, putative [Tetrahymena thermophila SB210]
MYNDNSEGLFGGYNSYQKYQDLPPLDIQPLLNVIKNQQQGHNQIQQTEQNHQQNSLFGYNQDYLAANNQYFNQAPAFNSISLFAQNQYNNYPQQQQAKPQLAYNQAYNPFDDFCQMDRPQSYPIQQINSQAISQALNANLTALDDIFYQQQPQKPIYQVPNQQFLNYNNQEIEQDDIGQPINSNNAEFDLLF